MSENTKQISRAAALSATKAGGEAARAGKKVTDCPYGTDDTADRFLRGFWVEGHAYASAASASK